MRKRGLNIKATTLRILGNEEEHHQEKQKNKNKALLALLYGRDLDRFMHSPGTHLWTCEAAYAHAFPPSGYSGKLLYLHSDSMVVDGEEQKEKLVSSHDRAQPGGKNLRAREKYLPFSMGWRNWRLRTYTNVASSQLCT